MANTVEGALVACGVNNINNVVGGQNNSTRMALDMFGSMFETSMDKTFSDLDDELSSYTSLTQPQGQIQRSTAQVTATNATVGGTGTISLRGIMGGRNSQSKRARHS